ncbi:DUF2497 domain-containing protein [Sphingomonas sp. YR710]|uniref:DUF2497 domain-containing protein n=1 Tax=Sphingomonas sp. YR710 TaxID=1882773 RepID=UPI0015A10E18|nr:DUF2497 domain-containing protein [Sphingomonas sp. YR710]
MWPTVEPDPTPSDSRSEPPAVRRVVERLRQSEAASSQARAASVAAVASIAEPAASAHAGPSLSSLIINPAGTGQTLEGLVRDMLRPMLSDWIDTNLPGIVERLVKQEMSGINDDQL